MGRHLTYVTRSISTEMSKLLNKRIVVKLVDGKTYVGKLVAFEPGALHVVLEDVDVDGNHLERVIIHGSRVSEIYPESTSVFDAEEFAALLKERLNLNPYAVRILPEINAVVVYDKIKITEAGVEGEGGLAQRIYEVFKEYIESKKRGH